MDLPTTTPESLGTGGRIRDRLEDFRVIEQPLYEPSGSGTHLFLRIEKRGLATPEAIRRIARALEMRGPDIGYAGLKDAQAVTEQTLSVEHRTEEDVRARLADVPGVRLLEAVPHDRKLKLGHLAGNRFELVIRGVVPDALARAEATLGALAARGCPNWFGEQRFGYGGRNHDVGRALVQRDSAAALAVLAEDGGRFAEALAAGKSPKRMLRQIPRRQLTFYVSAYQSQLFNRLLRERLETGLGTLEEGDLAWLHGRGAVFSVADVAAEQPRADALEISPSGPLYGLKTTLASGAPGEREAALLAAEGLTPADFKVPGAGNLWGARRPLRIPLVGVSAEAVQDEDDGGEDGDRGDAEISAAEGVAETAIRVGFVLPPGSYATVVLREVMKPARSLSE